MTKKGHIDLKEVKNDTTNKTEQTNKKNNS